MSTYDEELTKIEREPSYLVYLDLDYCARTFSVDPCLASGRPCYYTYPTCKFKQAYAYEGRRWKFCRKDAPLAFPGEHVLPYLISVDHLPTRIDPKLSITSIAKMRLTFLDDYEPMPFERGVRPDQYSNTQIAGSFWKNLKARYPNYRYRDATVLRGFIGLPESEYQTVFKGQLDQISILPNGEVRVVIKDAQKRLQRKLPAAISDDNVLASAINATTTTIPVTRAAEFSPSGTVQIDDEQIKFIGRDLVANTLDATGGRGAYGTTATSHAAGAALREILVYATDDGVGGLAPTDIMLDLLSRAGIPASDIDSESFSAEGNLWLAGWKFKRTIDKPKDVNKLLQELTEQTFSNIWVDEQRRFTFKVFAPGPPGAVLYSLDDEKNIILRSSMLEECEDERITRCLVYWDLIPGRDGDRLEHYNRVMVSVDLDAESEAMFSETREKVILSQWITRQSEALAVSARYVNRFRAGQRILKFALELKDSALEVGDLVRITSDLLLDEHGEVAKNLLFQVIAKKQTKVPNRLEYEAIDTRFRNRYAFIGPPTMAADYDDATEVDRGYGYIADAEGMLGDRDEPAYFLF